MKLAKLTTLIVLILFVGMAQNASADIAGDMMRKISLSKAALDAAENVILYHQLAQDGMDPDEAWRRVFMGIYTLWIPGLRPIPRPDTTYLSLPELDKALEDAAVEADSLRLYIEDMRLSIKDMMEKHNMINIPH